MDDHLNDDDMFKLPLPPAGQQGESEDPPPGLSSSSPRGVNKAPLPNPVADPVAPAPGMWFAPGAAPPNVSGAAQCNGSSFPSQSNGTAWNGAAPPNVNGAAQCNGSAYAVPSSGAAAWNGAAPPNINGAAQCNGGHGPSVVAGANYELPNPWHSWNSSLARHETMEVAEWGPKRSRYPADPHHRLRKAVMHNDRYTVMQALSQGGSMGPDKSGKTALHVAGNRGNYELLHILLSHGLNPNVRCKNGYNAVDETEYWAINRVAPAERERRYMCRNLLAVFGGRRSYDQEAVRNDRIRLERAHCGSPIPWHDDLDEIARHYDWLRDSPTSGPSFSPPPIADVPKQPEHYVLSSGSSSSSDPRPAVANVSVEAQQDPWSQDLDPRTSAWSRPSNEPTHAPVDHGKHPGPPSSRVETVPVTNAGSCQDPPPLQAAHVPGPSIGQPMPDVKMEEPPSLRELIPERFATHEEFGKATQVVTEALLDLAQHPRNLYIKKPPVAPLKNGQSIEV